jgi:hypothetical protein
MKRLFIAAVALVTAGCASMSSSSGPSSPAGSPSDSSQLLSIDHYVRVKSTAPSMAGQTALIYVRERVISR